MQFRSMPDHAPQIEVTPKFPEPFLDSDEWQLGDLIAYRLLFSRFVVLSMQLSLGAFGAWYSGALAWLSVAALSTPQS